MNAIVHNGTALVTGASSGIGAVYADRLARRGYDLILVARSGDKLKEQAARITDETGRSVETLSADLTKADDLARVERVLRTDASITLLVNNAGVGATAPLLQSDIAKMESMVSLNVIGPMRLTYAVAPSFVARGTGTIINIASIAAITPEVLNGVYGGSKAFILAFTQSLHHELAEKGVRVQAVLPGATATDFWDAAGLPLGHLPSEIVMSATDMVDAALSGLDQGEQVTIPALPNISDWNAFDTARLALSPNLSRAAPAARYLA
ncbi:SDR family oxidoreductase [Rhizobium leguminosarum]|uniref:SDR family NAD(P)-dependent oxidoreductase n=1 Tax=Rhizobium leguminosarum TaxID=384 RepID=UPI001C9185E7|nr:SDR family oxidoreductase [Rhizobium leguminosarum]MBY2924365.1 SDR family oxidoreductase [Rhizobium leguminosarum]